MAKVTIGRVLDQATDDVTAKQGDPGVSTTPWFIDLMRVGSTAVTLGQKAMTASIPVVLASDQTAIPVTQSGSWTVAATQSGSWTISVSGTVTVDTELPAAAALADNAANPTAPAVGAFVMVWDGATWDRAPGNSADGLLVNLGTNNDVTVTGTVTANAGTGTFTTSDTATQVDDAAFTPATGRVMMIGAFADETTPDAVDEGDGGTLRMTLQRGLHINLRNASGTEIGTAAAPVRIDPTGTTTQPVSGTISVSGTVIVDTELPAAAALADNTANPTVPAVGAFAMVWDGATWDRAPGTSADGLLVNLGANNDVTVTGTVTANQGGSWTVAATQSGAWTVAATQSGSWTVDTELPAAAALADATANPTTTSVGALALLFNGTTWDRMRGDTTNGLDVDVTRIIPGTSATALGKAEDAAHVTGDTGIFILAVRNDANATLTSLDGDYSPLAVDGEGNLMTIGNRAHDAIDAGDPLKIGGKATTGNPTNVATGDRVDAHFDLRGRLGVFAASQNGSVITTGEPSSDEVSPTGLNFALQGAFMYNFDGTNFNRSRGAANALNSTGTGLQTAQLVAQFDDTAPTSITENQFGNVRMSANRNLYGTIRDAAGNERGLNISAERAALVAGDTAHDAADAGSPVKIGGKAIDMEPDSDAEQGPTEVAANDRVNGLFHLNGGMVEVPLARWHAPDNVSTTYDDNPTTATSTAIECWKYRYCTIAYELDKANTPTDITIEVQISLDGTNYTKLTNDALGSLIYDDVAVGTGIEESYTFPIAAHSIRIKVTATGTTATNTFTIANFRIYLRN